MEKLPCELIPSLDELYKATCEYVKNHQGEKGYIDVQNTEFTTHDPIYALVWDDECGENREMEVHGVRYDEEYQTLDIIYESILRTVRIEYSDEDFRNEDAEWESLKGGYIHFSYTLISIAESIDQYVDDEDDDD